MASPSNRRATKRRRSSITELAFHGIHTSRPKKAKSVTHVSGTKCHLCLGPLIYAVGAECRRPIMLHLPDECAQEVGHHEFPPALGATTKKTNPKSSWFSAW